MPRAAMPALLAKMRAGLLVVVAFHACARVEVTAAQTAEELFRGGNALYDGGNTAEAQPLYLRAATDFRHAGSQYQVGLLCWHGHGVRMNKTEAVRWWKLASAQGYDLADSSLGHAFQLGEGGLTVNPDEAVRLFVLGAARGELHALAWLGYAHETGMGPLAVSKPVALGLYERSARQGHSYALYNAALLLHNGDTNIADDKMALVWCQLAADGGNSYAENSLAAFQKRCTGACRTGANALVQAFKPQNACKASLFNRTHFCNGSGAPTPK